MELSIFDKHQLKILLDTIRNPLKGKFLGGPTVFEAKNILKLKFGYTDEDITNVIAKNERKKWTKT